MPVLKRLRKCLLTAVRAWDFGERQVLGTLSKCLVLTGLIISFVEIVKRFVLGTGYVWSEEMITYTMLLGVLLYFGIAHKERAHLRVTFLLSYLGERGRAAADIFMSIMGLVYFGLILLYLAPTIRILYEKGARSYGAAVPLYIIYGVLGIAIVFFALRLIEQLHEAVRQLMRNKGEQ